MALTPINSEDRLAQATFAEHLEVSSAGRASMPGTTRLSGLPQLLAGSRVAICGRHPSREHALNIRGWLRVVFAASCR